MRKIFKIIVSIALSIILCFSLSSCTQNDSSEGSYSPSTHPPYQAIPKPSPPHDWDAMLDSLNDALEQIESKHTYVITYSARLKYNNSVGDSWGYGVAYDGEYIESGCYIERESILNLYVTAFATEYDSYNDYGSTCVTFDSFDVGEKQSKEVIVTVRENRGRYSGNTAQWLFVITVERIT